MPADFGYCWRTVRLYCPSAPTFLAREWVQTAWKQLLAARRWSFMRGTLAVPYDGSSPYVTMPADFASFDIVVDTTQQKKICTDQSLSELTCSDPTHALTGPPRALVPAPPGPNGE